MDVDRAAGVQGCGFSVERHHFADDADSLVGELLEVLGIDSGGGFVCHRGRWGGSGKGEVVEKTSVGDTEEGEWMRLDRLSKL